MKKIYAWEPWFFIFFGVFHIHRLWALIDRNSYADFWLKILESRGAFYFILMGVLASLCVLGIATFCRSINSNFWWRWIYIFGGCYVLFDLLAIATNLKIWSSLLLMMFDVQSVYWNYIWGFFIALGVFVLVLGVKLLCDRKTQV